MSQQLENSSNSDESTTFDGTIDMYGGITVNFIHDQPNMDKDEFSEKLHRSLEQWHAENRRTIWMNISVDFSDFVPVLTRNHFLFHHVSLDNRILTLYRWLPTDVPNLIPKGPHTMIGIGAIVINDSGQLLVVSELIRPGYLKFPGGYVEPNEELDDAVKREVLEETGIHTIFESLVLFRHMKERKSGGAADIYFVAKLKPTSTTIVKDKFEIEHSQWMDIEEFLNNPSVYAWNKKFLKAYLLNKEHGIQMTKEVCTYGIFQKPFTVYYIESQNTKN